MKPINEMRLRIESRSVNEAFARAATLDRSSAASDVYKRQDIKTAVSEAVTNCIVHAYADSVGQIYIWAGLYEDGGVRIKIRDTGCGIEDVKKAMEPLYTTLGEERAGLGFAVMESFCDRLGVRSAPGKGTTVTLTKYIKGRNGGDD